MEMRWEWKGRKGREGKGKEGKEWKEGKGMERKERNGRERRGRNEKKRELLPHLDSRDLHRNFMENIMSSFFENERPFPNFLTSKITPPVFPSKIFEFSFFLQSAAKLWKCPIDK